MTIRSSCAVAVRVSDSSGVAVRATSRKIVDEPLHERFAINSVVATSLREAAVDSIAELPKLHRAKFVTVFHEPECLPNHLTCRVVTARSNLFLDESLEFRRQMNVHEPTYVFRTTNTKNVQIGQCWTCDSVISQPIPVRFLITRHTPRSTLFPYTTLFRPGSR